MSGIYSTKTPSLQTLDDVGIQTSTLSNNDNLSYNSATRLWENKSDFITDEIDCRVLRVSETADVEGRLANKGVASFVNDEFIFQNGISNLGDTIYINNNDNKIGINNANPQHALDVVGHIRLQSGGADRLIFNNTTTGDIAHVDAIVDGTNGGIWGVRTKVDGGALTEKLRINNVGAVGIAGANYGTTGQVLTSAGSGAVPTWTTPSGGGGGGITEYATFTYQPATEQIITNTFTALQYNTTNTIGGSDITLDTTTNIGRITLASTGVYMINYYSTSYVYSGSTRVITECILYVNPNIGTFSQEVGTRSFCYLRQSADPENTAGVSYLLNVSASNTEVELRFKTADPIDRAKMKSLCCGITIVKIA